MFELEIEFQRDGGARIQAERRDDGKVIVRQIPSWQLEVIKRAVPDVYRFLVGA